MKTIYLKVEVPKDSEINSVWVNKIGKTNIWKSEFTERHLPTEEEMVTTAKQQDMSPYEKIAFLQGMQEYESKIKKP